MYQSINHTHISRSLVGKPAGRQGDGSVPAASLR